jgi:hypothetical protein
MGNDNDIYCYCFLIFWGSFKRTSIVDDRDTKELEVLNLLIIIEEHLNNITSLLLEHRNKGLDF